MLHKLEMYIKFHCLPIEIPRNIISFNILFVSNIFFHNPQINVLASNGWVWCLFIALPLSAACNLGVGQLFKDSLFSGLCWEFWPFMDWLCGNCIKTLWFYGFFFLLWFALFSLFFCFWFLVKKLWVGVWIWLPVSVWQLCTTTVQTRCGNIFFPEYINIRSSVQWNYKYNYKLI